MAVLREEVVVEVEEGLHIISYCYGYRRQAASIPPAPPGIGGGGGGGGGGGAGMSPDVYRMRGAF